jgi:hypothetical protein
MLKQYLVVSYAYLVKIGRWDLEPTEGSTKKAVPEEYRVAVAEYLAQ